MDGFYGKFRGEVVNNNDPNKLGRLTARVPDVFGENESGWALPATPFAGKGVGLYLIPPAGALVWIEFEHGDPEYPVWSGCFWGAESEVPADPVSPDVKVLKTTAGTITINDTSGSTGITIETADGKKIVMDSNGIEITVGQAVVKLSGPTVSVNSGALEVT
jgi:uncharacterized protein involved in type VI secretion and phage assembly